MVDVKKVFILTGKRDQNLDQMGRGLLGFGDGCAMRVDFLLYLAQGLHGLEGGKLCV
jgi:hypothetical protein